MQAKEQQFKELFLSEYGRMYKAAYILLGDEDEAKDVVQDIFAKLWAGTVTIKGYNFNVSNSKYKGTGAGNEERNGL